MAFFKIGNTGIAFGSLAQAIDLSQGEGPTAGLTHSLSIQYVDGSGVLQTATATPGSGLSITVPLGSKVVFDARNCVSVDTGADTEGEAWTALGHRFDAGDNLPDSWEYGGGLVRIAEGPGMFHYVYEVEGTHSFRHWCRDASGRQSLLTVSITVPALGAGTDVSVGGSWPVLANGTILNLAAGTDHSAKGDIVIAGLHNVVVRKTGVGADPIISGITLHNTDYAGGAQQRTRGCRTIGVDVGVVNERGVGSLFCGVIKGRLREYNTSPHSYWWSAEAVGETEKNNVRRARGFTAWRCGEINSNGTNYVYIGEAKYLTIKGCTLRKDSGTNGQHIFRGWFEGLDLQHNRLYSTVDYSSFIKIQGADNDTTFDAWDSDDRMGVWNGAAYQPVCGFNVIWANQLGESGDIAQESNIEYCPENDTGVDQAIQTGAIGENIFYRTTLEGWAPAFAGRHIQYQNNRLNMGAGAVVSASTGSATGRLGRVPPGWDGPYINAARPVVVP